MSAAGRGENMLSIISGPGRADQNSGEFSLVSADSIERWVLLNCHQVWVGSSNLSELIFVISERARSSHY